MCRSCMKIGEGDVCEFCMSSNTFFFLNFLGNVIKKFDVKTKNDRGVVIWSVFPLLGETMFSLLSYLHTHKNHQTCNECIATAQHLELSGVRCIPQGHTGSNWHLSRYQSTSVSTVPYWIWTSHLSVSEPTPHGPSFCHLVSSPMVLPLVSTGVLWKPWCYSLYQTVQSNDPLCSSVFTAPSGMSYMHVSGLTRVSQQRWSYGRLATGWNPTSPKLAWGRRYQ